MRILINDELKDFCLKNIIPYPHIESCQPDLSIAEVDLMTTEWKPELLRSSRKTAGLRAMSPDFNDSFILKPRALYQVTTKELITLPSGYIMPLFPRRTTFASGLSVHCTNVAPGYQGRLSFTVQNMMDTEIVLGVGFRVVTSWIIDLEGESEVYAGFWMGGRHAGTGNNNCSPT